MSQSRYLQQMVIGQPTTDGAGVDLVRMIGHRGLMDLDPFLMLDAFRSDDPDSYIAGFPSHPHRGFETVTYLLNGRMRHKDNAGNEGVIEPGGIQWMTAGKGIVHSEMPEQQDGLLEGFQLWINLPASDKLTQPGYQEFSDTEIPTESRPGTRIKVITGRTCEGTVGPVEQPLTDPLYLDVDLQANTEFVETLPAAHNAFVYVINGELQLTDETGAVMTLSRDQLGILGDGDSVDLTSLDDGARFLLIAGKPLKEPVVRAGPFVMNTEQELQRAFYDFQTGNF